MICSGRPVQVKSVIERLTEALWSKCSRGSVLIARCSTRCVTPRVRKVSSWTPQPNIRVASSGPGVSVQMTGTLSMRSWRIG